MVHYWYRDRTRLRSGPSGISPIDTVQPSKSEDADELPPLAGRYGRAFCIRTVSQAIPRNRLLDLLGLRVSRAKSGAGRADALIQRQLPPMASGYVTVAGRGLKKEGRWL